MRDTLENVILGFQKDITRLNSNEVISKYFYNDFEPHALSLDLYHKLRLKIKEEFPLESIFDVFLVGSGRLGFTVKPEENYRHFNENESDLDLVIISKELFLAYWKFARDHCPNLHVWKEKGVFEEYFFNGWMRPDMFPKTINVPLSGWTRGFNWWDYFNRLNQSRKFGMIHINAGLYYSLDFFESYQKKAINALKTLGDLRK